MLTPCYTVIPYNHQEICHVVCPGHRPGFSWLQLPRVGEVCMKRAVNISMVLGGCQSASPLHPRTHDRNSRSEDQSSEVKQFVQNPYKGVSRASLSHWPTFLHAPGAWGRGKCVPGGREAGNSDVMADSLDMLGGMEPQPGRRKRPTFLGTEAKLFPQFVSCTRCHPAFWCSMSRTGLLFTSNDGLAPTGSVRTQPRAHAAPSPWTALCFCCLGNSWSAQQTPALRSPRARSLPGLSFFGNPTPPLLWAASGCASLTLLHCN